MGKNIDMILDIGNRVDNKKQISKWFLFSFRIGEFQKLDQDTKEKIKDFAKNNNLTDLLLQMQYIENFGDLFNDECSVNNGITSIVLKTGDVDVNKMREMLKFHSDQSQGVHLEIRGQECGNIVDKIIDKESAHYITNLALNDIENFESLTSLSLCENANILKINKCNIDANNEKLFNFIPKSIVNMLIHNCKGQLTETHVSSFSNLTNLKKLTIDGGTILSNDAKLDGLPNCLKELSLDKCNLLNSHISSLPGLENLKLLNISHNQHIDGSSFGNLPGNINTLDCSYCSISNDAVANLSGLKKLSELNITFNAQLDGSTFRDLPSSLRRLLCDGRRIKHDIHVFENLKGCSIVRSSF